MNPNTRNSWYQWLVGQKRFERKQKSWKGWMACGITTDGKDGILESIAILIVLYGSEPWVLNARERRKG